MKKIIASVDESGRKFLEENIGKVLEELYDEHCCAFIEKGLEKHLGEPIDKYFFEHINDAEGVSLNVFAPIAGLVEEHDEKFEDEYKRMHVYLPASFEDLRANLTPNCVILVSENVSETYFNGVMGLANNNPGIKVYFLLNDRERYCIEAIM